MWIVGARVTGKLPLSLPKKSETSVAALVHFIGREWTTRDRIVTAHLFPVLRVCCLFCYLVQKDFGFA